MYGQILDKHHVEVSYPYFYTLSIKVAASFWAHNSQRKSAFCFAAKAQLTCYLVQESVKNPVVSTQEQLLQMLGLASFIKEVDEIVEVRKNQRCISKIKAK